MRKNQGNPRFLWTTLSLCCLLLIGVVSVYGQDDEAAAASERVPQPIIVADEREKYSLGLHLKILEDVDGAWTFEDVTSPDLAAQFVPSETIAPNFGFTESAYWVRFRVKNEADELVRWLLKLDSTLSFIDVYIPTADAQSVATIRTGSQLPYNTRDVNHPDYVFDLRLEPGEEKIVHLRVESEPALRVPLSILSAATLARESMVDLTIDGVLFGMLLIMIGYNLILFVYLRDASYVYFALFLVGSLTGVLWVSNMGHRYLWPNAGRFNTIAGQFSFMFSMVFTLLFTRSFLATKENAPRLDNIIIAVVAAFAVLMTIQFWNARFTARIGIVLLLLSYVLIIVVGMLVWWRGYRSARYFVLAWLLWLTNSLVYVLSLTGFIPSAIFVEIGSALGILILVLTLSLALIDRINILKDEREATQLELVRQQQEAIQLKDEFASTLQGRVDERTAELVVARDEAEEARQREAARRRVAEGLSDVIGALNSDRSLAEILDLIAERSRTLLQADAVLIYSLDPGSETVSVQSIQGLPGDSGDPSAFALDYTVLSQTLNSVQPTTLAGPDYLPMMPDDRFRELLALPISVEERRSDAGMILYYVESSALSADETELGALFAAQAGLAIESAELRQEAEQLAVSSERDRIARDLHDSVTQALFSASLIAEALPGVWERRPEMALSSLQELRSLTQGALAEMRSLLLELRPGELSHRKLGELLRQLADATSARTELPITVSVTGDCTFPQDVQIALYRIAQEALNNVVKHARAARAAISLDCSEAGATLCISDNGRGIEPKSSVPDRHGLKIMRERADAIGAQFTIHSELEQGAEVTVEWRPTTKESKHE